MDDFELSTGRLHFSHAMDVGNISINVLDEKDLLRLKVISVDTAMTELEATGEFARVKDFHDIYELMGRLEMTPEDTIREYSDYMICYSDTGDLLHAIANDGPDGGLRIIENKKKEFDDIADGASFFEGADSFSEMIDRLDAMIDGLRKE